MIVDGKAITEELILEVEEAARLFPGKKVCFLAFNTSPAGRSFVEMKTRVALRLGIEAHIIEERIQETRVAREMVAAFSTQGYDALVVQLPLSEPLETEPILDAIPLSLDIDMLSLQAKEAYRNKTTERVPPVARAIDEIVKKYKISLHDKNVVLLGRGRLVGEPISMLLDKRGVSYSVIDKDSSTTERRDQLKEADVVISGVGVPHLVKPEMIKTGAVLLDAGTSEDGGKLVGDIDPECISMASLITPVPGGVGPITVASLFSNLYRQ
jgi:methylenetetrahydrofolate dehydrogenase (NADP+) / methenyltetrahydrofolate cyclohydrolase